MNKTCFQLAFVGIRVAGFVGLEGLTRNMDMYVKMIEMIIRLN